MATKISLRRNGECSYAGSVEARREVADVLRRLGRRLYGYPDPAEHSYLAQLRREWTRLRLSAERAAHRADQPAEDLVAEVDRLTVRVEEYVGAHPPRR